MIVPALALEAAMEQAERHLRSCTLCPHMCGPARADGQGVCRVATESYVASEMLHMGEEKLLQPAHAIFFSGCTATCSFCIASRFAFRPRYGVTVSPQQLAARVVQRQREGARALCFIGGDPTPHVPFILATLAELGERRHIPTVFNSNLYLSTDALTLLAPAIDIYLPDLKFGPAVGPRSCGEQLGGMPDYWAVVTENIRRLQIAGRRVIVRHLLMPGHMECCTRPVLAWLAEQPDLEISLLSQFLASTPVHGRQSRQTSRAELDTAHALAQAYGLVLVE